MSHGLEPRAAWLHPRAIFLVCLILAFLLVGREGLFKDPGTFWHCVVGEEILRTSQLPTADHFSSTRAGRPWIAQQWLGECAMAVARRTGGLDTLLLAAATLLGLTFSALGHRFMRAGVHASAAALLVAILLGACSYHFHVRPHLITLAFTTWLMALLVDVEAGRASPQRLYWLPLLFIVWTNVHGGALGGLATLGLAIAGWLLAPQRRRRLPPPDAPSASARMLAVVGLLSVAAVGVNHYGLELPRVWFGLMGSTVLPRLILEHRPLELSSFPGIIVLGLAAIYLGLLAATWRKGRIVCWIPLLWLALGVARVRHAPLFAVTAAVAIAEMLPLSSLPAWFARRGSDVLTGRSRMGRTPRAAWIPPAVLVLTALALQAAGIRCPIVGRGWVRLAADYWPIQATRVLEDDLARTGASPRLFNDMLYGGYLIDRLPQLPVFIDDRCELYGDEFLAEYGRVLNEPDRLGTLARRWGFTVALVPTGGRFDQWFRAHPPWRLRHGDSTASLFERPAESAPD